MLIKCRQGKSQNSNPMKTIFKLSLILVGLFLLQSCLISRRTNIDFFESKEFKDQNAEIISINVPMSLAKPYIKRALREESKEDSKELIKIVKSVNKIKLIAISDASPKTVQNFKNYLSKNNYAEWMTITQDGQHINIQAQQDGDDNIKKLMLLVDGGENELVLIDVKGLFTANDISKLINVAN